MPYILHYPILTPFKVMTYFTPCIYAYIYVFLQSSLCINVRNKWINSRLSAHGKNLRTEIHPCIIHLTIMRFRKQNDYPNTFLLRKE